MPVGNDNASAFAHLEQRVSYLLERIETSSEPRSGNLGRVEDALQDILRHLESQHAAVVALAENNRNTSAPQPFDGGVADMVKREMSDIRFSQSETDRRTQDSLEAVHNTLGHVVDRLAMIEGDLRTARALPVAAQPQMPPAPQPEPPQAAAPRDGDAAAAEAGTAKSRRGPRAFRHRAARIPGRAARRLSPP